MFRRTHQNFVEHSGKVLSQLSVILSVKMVAECPHVVLSPRTERLLLAD